MTHRQREWLADDTTTKEQRMAFFARGQVEVVQMVNLKDKATAKSRSAPVVRGVLVGNEKFDTPDEAIAAGEKFKAHAKAEAGEWFEKLDERALGIDDRHVDVMEACENENLSIERVLHLGALAGNPDRADSDALERLHDADWSGLPEPLRGIPFPDPMADDGEDEEEAKSAMVEKIRSIGYFGFLIEVSTPVPTHFMEGDGHSYSNGFTTSKLFYVDDFADFVPLAIKWKEDFYAEEKKKFFAKAKKAKKAVKAETGG